MVKYHYPNILFNQNKTAKPNIAWVADITSFDSVKKYYVFLCIDVHTNRIVAFFIRSTPIESSDIIRVLSKAIEKRFKTFPDITSPAYTWIFLLIMIKIYRKFFL